MTAETDPPEGRPAAPAPRTLAERTAALAARREEYLRMGGEASVAKQHAAGKLTARERIGLLVDPHTEFVESGLFAHSTHADLANKPTPADGTIGGTAVVGGRPVTVCASDFTVLAGSIGAASGAKIDLLLDRALVERTPFVWMVDSAGARIQERIGSAQFVGAGGRFRRQVVMSGVVPQVAAVMGPCMAGTAYVPALCDFIVMVKGTSSMALGGARLVAAAVKETVTDYEIGGPEIHCQVSGVADAEARNDQEAIDIVRRYLSYMPSHNGEAPPAGPRVDPAGRRAEVLREIVPGNPRQAYDMLRVIAEIVDRDSFFPLKAAWARNIVTGFARLDGSAVGIVANQPMVLGGVLDVNAADKAARFINLCDAFNIPLLFLVDVPGFVVGSAVEKQGIIRHGAKMLYAVSEATVPKVTVVVRKAYGAGYFVMCGREFETNRLLIWPTAEISVMGPEGGANILHQAEKGAEGEHAAARERFQAMIDPYAAAAAGLVDDIIDPADTRPAVIQALAASRRKTVIRPPKKHGVVPV